jgi:hypothetical protein
LIYFVHRPEEQFIKLDRLPDIVVKKWEEKKKKLRKIHEREGNDSLARRWQDWGALPNAPTNEDTASNASSYGEENQDVYKVNPGADDEITRLQLQRLIDEDLTLPKVLGTTRAIDVIRTFSRDSVPDEVTKLQQNVYKKIDKLEKRGLAFDGHEVPAIQNLSDDLYRITTMMQNNWRGEVTQILEGASGLSEVLMELTHGTFFHFYFNQT